MAISGTVVTVIALVLGLSVVALTTASSQYSPRLLRNFLRDRTNQLVLSVFLASFTFSAAGLYTVGVGEDAETFPRLVVSGSILLLFASLAAVVVFSDHLSHSIQVDKIMGRVERQSLATARRLRESGPTLEPPQVPDRAVPVPARSSGYVVTAHPETLLPVADRYGICIALTKRVGEHVVADRTLAEIWTTDPAAPLPPLDVIEMALDEAIGIGFERTYQQDVAMGIRQLVDTACKALSPAVNDPYTAVQAVDHLSVIFHELTKHRLGPIVAASGPHVVVVPSRRFEQYLSTMCGLIRRYCSAEPTVSLALLHLLENCAVVAKDDETRLMAIADEAWLITADAKREIRQVQDFKAVKDASKALISRLERYRRPSPPVTGA